MLTNVATMIHDCSSTVPFMSRTRHQSAVRKMSNMSLPCNKILTTPTSLPTQTTSPPPTSLSPNQNEKSNISTGKASIGFVRQLGITKANEALITSRRITCDELFATGAYLVDDVETCIM